jgi:xylulokinase
MSQQYILAHDLGTTGDKACLYKVDGELLASSTFDYKTYYPHFNWVEQKPAEWWKAVCDSTRKLLEENRIPSDEIACVSFSGQMLGCVPIDKEGCLLRESVIIWLDGRSHEEARYIREKMDEKELYHMTGASLRGESYSRAKIMWMKKNEPGIFRKVHKFLNCKDYIIHKLTGKILTDFSDASQTGLLDITKKEWSEEVLKITGIPGEMMPELHSSVDIAGEVTPLAAEQTGLRKGTPVIVGGGDVCTTAAGAGAIEEGRVYNYLGSSSWIAAASNKPLFEDKIRPYIIVHVIPGMFTSQVAIFSACISYQWVKDNLCQVEEEQAKQLGKDVYDIMEELASKVNPGSDNLLFFPSMAGTGNPDFNVNIRGGFIGLGLNHKKEHLIRAAIEGVIFNLRLILELFEKTEIDIKEIRAVGGGAKSRLWRQLMADIFGKRILQPSILQEVGSLGAAVAGGVGVGLFKDFSVMDKFTKIIDTHEPRPIERGKYEELFPIFKDLYGVLGSYYERLAVVGSA